MEQSNPYTGATFFGFFVQLFWRIIAFVQGDFKLQQLATDEIQILVLTGVSISAALVGTFLVLRRMTMLANALSHTILLGIVVAFVLTRDGLLTQETHGSMHIQALLFASLAMGVITTFLTEFLTKTVRLQADASTGVVFTSLFALGIVLVTMLTRDVHIGTEVVMGNVDALRLDDCKLVYSVLLLNLVLFFLFFKEFQLTTFDPGLARSLGVSTVFFNYLLMIQVSATSIAAFRAVGVIMVLALMTGPTLTARLITHNLKQLMALSVGFAILSSISGVALARHFLTVYNTPLTTGGLVVCVIAIIFAVVLAIHLFIKAYSRPRDNTLLKRHSAKAHR